MSAAEVNRLHFGVEDTDCGICSLAAYLGVPYPDVLRAAVAVDRSKVRRGLGRRTMIRIAAELGVTLRRRKVRAGGYGIVVSHDHAGVLRNWLVLDRATVWDADAWFTTYGTKPEDCVLLEAVD